jgi:hypothetical protein
MILLSRFSKTSILAIYLIWAIGGRAIHQIEHMVNDSPCCEDTGVTTCEAAIGQHTHCSDDHSEHLELSFSKLYVFSENPLSTNKDHESDPSDCWTCNSLSQSQSISYDVIAPLCNASVFLQNAESAELYLTALISDCLARGPPTVLMPLS